MQMYSRQHCAHEVRTTYPKVSAEEEEIRQSIAQSTKSGYNGVSSETDPFYGSIMMCICANPKAEVGYMVQCDGCLLWLHASCDNIQTSQVPDFYLCPRCRALQVIVPEHRKVKTAEQSVVTSMQPVEDTQLNIT